jgi:hypothetical protein
MQEEVAMVSCGDSPDSNGPQNPPPEPVELDARSAQLKSHYRTVARALAKGWVVPFLGAGANLCGRPAGEPFAIGKYLPSGRELALHLAESCEYPLADVDNLVRVSQYHAIMNGAAPLYRELREVFAAEYPLTPLHVFLAGLGDVLEAKGRRCRHQLLVTTNYDDALEHAFRLAGVEFDLVSYVAHGEDRGRFLHRAPDGRTRVIERPNKYEELSLEVRPVILKIHGAIDRQDRDRDSFVITEDHYIDFLMSTEIESLIPVTLIETLTETHFLFLGYSMRDWNLRVILQRIWGEQELGWQSWAVQLQVEEIDRKFWGKRGVEILEIDLEEYIGGLRAAVLELPPAGTVRAGEAVA